MTAILKNRYDIITLPPVVGLPVDIIRTVYYIHGAELMKLIFAILDVSSTVGLTRCYKTESFYAFITIKTALNFNLIL